MPRLCTGMILNPLHPDATVTNCDATARAADAR